MFHQATRRAVLASCAAAAFAPVARAQQLQGRYIRLLVGFGAGGATDVLARLYAQKLQQIGGSAVVVDDKPGASQVLATRLMLGAPADGYTLLYGTGSGLAQGPGVIKGLPYDPLKDFTFIAMLATAPGIFVVDPKLPIHSIGDLIAYAKANPGTLNFGSAGVGSASHLQMEYVQQAANLNMQHIPYKSDQESIQEIIGGRIQVALSVAQPAVPFITAGNVRALAVTGAKRLSVLPDVPSLAETGLRGLQDVDNYTFYGLIGPAGIPAPVVQRLNTAMNTISTMPDVVKEMRDVLMVEPVTETPQEFHDYVEKQIVKWQAVSKSIDMPAWGN
jgi:tripartite-type tricarboxylate transporter receptor subunit TctC